MQLTESMRDLLEMATKEVEDRTKDIEEHAKTKRAARMRLVNDTGGQDAADESSQPTG